jgi:hypothetical protein
MDAPGADAKLCRRGAFHTGSFLPPSLGQVSGDGEYTNATGKCRLPPSREANLPDIQNYSGCFRPSSGLRESDLCMVSSIKQEAQAGKREGNASEDCERI